MLVYKRADIAYSCSVDFAVADLLGESDAGEWEWSGPTRVIGGEKLFAGCGYGR